MALIKCPECGRDVSDKAASCPNCGCPIEKASAPFVPVEEVRFSSERYTDVGRFHGHNIFLYLGVAVLLLSFPLFLLGGLGIITAFFAALMMAVGISSGSRRADCTCPYCGTKGELYADRKNYKCHACKKISVYVETRNQLKTVE